jgi:hypothetical protein
MTPKAIKEKPLPLTRDFPYAYFDKETLYRAYEKFTNVANSKAHEHTAKTRHN